MVFRCLHCDYVGEEIASNEETDTACPICNGDCEEAELMTEEDDELLERFIYDNKDSFLYPEGDYQIDEEDLVHQLLWEDFAKTKEVIKNIREQGQEIFIYTVVSGDYDTALVTKGWHYVNRIGYFLSTKDIELSENGIRYW